MKKRMVSVMLMMVVAASMVMYGCGNKVQEAPKSSIDARAAEPEGQEEEFSEDDLEGVVTGLDDHYIMEKAKDIDYLYNVQYDEDIVVSVKENGAEKVDVSKTGKYAVTYTVTVDKEALEDYVEKKSEKSEKDDVKETEKKDTDRKSDESKADAKDDPDQAADSKDTEEKSEAKEEASKELSEDKETVDIEVKKDMTVVDEEKAKELADKGEAVWTDKNEAVKKSDGTEVKEDAETPASTKGKETADTTQKTEKPVSGNTGNGSGSKPAQQAHTHNYNIPVTTVRHHDAVTQQVWVQDSAAWDEPIYGNRTICTTCGADLTGTDYAWHDCGTWTVKQVQTGTVHHEGTGHYENRVVQNAWDETVTTGYKCSCGAVQ